jgi:TctA family transporter
MVYSEKELAFLRIICKSQHEHVTQDSVQAQLVESELMTPDEFKQVKKKLLYSGVIGIVYGNITVEKREIVDLFMDESSI